MKPTSSTSRSANPPMSPSTPFPANPSRATSPWSATRLCCAPPAWPPRSPPPARKKPRTSRWSSRSITPTDELRPGLSTHRQNHDRAEIKCLSLPIQALTMYTPPAPAESGNVEAASTSSGAKARPGAGRLRCRKGCARQAARQVRSGHHGHHRRNRYRGSQRPSRRPGNRHRSVQDPARLEEWRAFETRYGSRPATPASTT